MFIAELSVNAKVKRYQGIHRLGVQYWELLTPDPQLAPISETQLRERLKNPALASKTCRIHFSNLFYRRVGMTIKCLPYTGL